jgi:hypothetical protein
VLLVLHNLTVGGGGAAILLDVGVLSVLVAFAQKERDQALRKSTLELAHTMLESCTNSNVDSRVIFHQLLGAFQRDKMLAKQYSSFYQSFISLFGEE